MSRAALVDSILLAFVVVAGMKVFVAKRGEAPGPLKVAKVAMADTTFLARVPRVDPKTREILYEAEQHSVKLGSMDAPVRIVAFVNHACGHCAGLLRSLLTLRHDLPDAVGVALVDFLPPGDPGLVRTHLAAHCLASEGHLGDFVHAVASRPEAAGLLNGWKGFSRDAGVEVGGDLTACVLAQRHLEDIEAGVQLGEKLGIDQTPVFFINDRPVVGDMPLADLRGVVTEILRPVH